MTAITINDINPRIQETASAGQIVFTYNFPIMAEADILVYKTPVSTDPSDVGNLLTLTTDYSVTGVGVATGGTIVTVLACSAGDKITMQRNRSLARSAVFPAGGEIASETLDTEFNSLLLMIQQTNMKIEKLQIKYQNSETIDTTIDRRLPKLAAKQTWRMNTAGTGLEAMTVEESGEAATLRADLALNGAGDSGAMIVGNYNIQLGSANTVDEDLTQLNTRVKSLEDGGQPEASTPHGSVLFYVGLTAPTGWVLMDEKTIGDATSGATGRANIDCQDLFKLIWNSVSDTYAPVVSGRGASADFDWAAHKQITLTKALGRAICSAGSGSGLTPRTIGSYVGAETHTLSVAEIPSHTHNYERFEPPPTIHVGYAEGFDTVGTASTTATGGGQSHNNIQPSTFLNVIIKL